MKSLLPKSLLPKSLLSKSLLSKSLLFSTIVLTLASTSGPTSAGSHINVYSSANDGVGSLRAALASGANVIRIADSVAIIRITEGLEYSGTARLKLIGDGQVIDGSALRDNSDILTLSQGANAFITDISLVGNGDEINPDPTTPTGGKGIYVNVPSGRTGLVKINLQNVSVFRVGNHGVHVSDCTLGDDCGSGSGGGGAGDGSSATILVKLDNVHINGVGFGKADADGVRIDDRGDGDIYFSAYNSRFLNVGGDGVELDEGNSGNVIADIRNSVFDSNGEYCKLVSAFEGGPCDDDGERDVDDGFDIDEAGDGGLYVSIRDTELTNNFDEGLDFDEEGAGSIQARVSRLYAGDNADEGIKMSEQGEGNLRARLRHVNLIANNASKEGIELEEADAGDVSVWVANSSLIGGADEALKIEQADGGLGKVSVRNSSLVLDLDGVSEF